MCESKASQRCGAADLPGSQYGRHNAQCMRKRLHVESFAALQGQTCRAARRKVNTTNQCMRKKLLCCMHRRKSNVIHSHRTWWFQMLGGFGVVARRITGSRRTAITKVFGMLMMLARWTQHDSNDCYFLQDAHDSRCLLLGRSIQEVEPDSI